MVAMVPPDGADRAIETLAGHGIRAWVAGRVSLDEDAGGQVLMTGQHPGW
jgi:phosphoribosylformylglycinamidine cyclo-ligase